MRRYVFVALILALVLALVLPLLNQGTPTRAQNFSAGARVTQVDTSQYPKVMIYVSVHDANGQPLSNLTQSDFRVTEDGTPVTISGFRGGGSEPISTVLVLDRSGSMESDRKLWGAQAAARTFVLQMRPGDETAVIAFNSDSEMLRDFSANRDALGRAIDQLIPDGGTALYDSVIAGVDALKDRPGRRVLLLLTDGRDCRDPGRCPSTEGSRNSLDTAIDYAQQHNQAVYVVGLGRRNGNEEDGINEAALQRIASETGGEYFYTPRADELAALYKRLAGSLHQEYILTYTSPRPFYDGTRRDIQVQVAAQTVTGAYTERHMINVQSHPLVGVALLLPLLALLVVPLLRGAGWKRLSGSESDATATPSLSGAESNATALPAPEQAGPVEAVPLPAALPTPSSPATTTGSITIVPGDVRRCVACDTPLRPNARFCNSCGAAQPSSSPQPPPQATQRSFCDQCGRPLRPDARFCTTCGSGVTLETPSR